MKKRIALAIFLLLVGSVAYGASPIPIDESNVLPDGNYYGSVTVKQLSPACVKITADANQAILVPIPNSNFGIQAFGFNYAGDPSCLQITLPTGWQDKTNSNLDGFGKFVEKTDTTGSYRLDPLAINVCNTCGNLAESDVTINNAKGYTFSMHIADFAYGGTAYDGTSSAFFATQETTEITLAKLEALPGNRMIIIRWQTETEIENAGFNIWRSETNADFERINPEMISAYGLAAEGAIYVYPDTNLNNRKTYYYMLEDIDQKGLSTFHGPISATPKFIYFWQLIY